ETPSSRALANSFSLAGNSSNSSRATQVFAAGDIVEGDKTVVYAVKTGKEAAEAIHHYLEGACSC
ncbi:hypothetical protein ACUOA5_26540, partial [Escherichia coli]